MKRPRRLRSITVSVAGQTDWHKDIFLRLVLVVYVARNVPAEFHQNVTISITISSVQSKSTFRINHFSINDHSVAGFDTMFAKNDFTQFQ